MFSAVRSLGDGAFRVIWFGNVVGASSVDRVIVVFSPSTVNKSSGEVGFDLSVRFQVSIPVAFLREFRIGDIWMNGRRTGRRENESQEMFELNVGAEAVEVMPIGVPIGASPPVQRYLLPFTDFVGHQDHTRAQCARVGLADGTTLVIPCMELIRFYFGASGSFLKRLFSGAFALDRLYSSAYLNPTTLVGTVDLAPDLAGVAAATVARIAFDRQAKSAARWIVNCNVATTINRVSYYPKTTFPFFGKTTLAALGRWIGQGEGRVFLAEQLLSCTHPFPFHTLYYTTTRSVAKNGDGKQGFSGYAVASEDISPSGTASTIQLTDSSVSSTLLSAHVGIEGDSEVCFPDLSRKKVRRVGTRPPFAAAQPDRRTAGELGGGESASTSEVRGAEVTSAPDDVFLNGTRPPEAVEAFERAVNLNRTTRAGYMEWQPIRGQNTREPQEPFYRGDQVVTDDTEPRLKDIWVGVLQVATDEIRDTVLVLIRDNVTEDVGDHVALVRLERPDARARIEDFCVSFANRRASPEFDGLLVRTLHTELSTNLPSLLRNLSMLATSLFYGPGHERAVRSLLSN